VPDEVSAITAEAIANQAADAISKIEPFSVCLPRLNIYPSVVFCEVHNEGQLETLHRNLMELPEVPEFQHDGDGYGPHITLAQFQGTSDFADLLQWMEHNREVSVGSAQIEAISLVEVNPHAFFPEFRTIRQYSLRNEGSTNSQNV
jgi:2'-5' RNA ligase